MWLPLSSWLCDRLCSVLVPMVPIASHRAVSAHPNAHLRGPVKPFNSLHSSTRASCVSGGCCGRLQARVAAACSVTDAMASRANVLPPSPLEVLVLSMPEWSFDEHYKTAGRPVKRACTKQHPTRTPQVCSTDSGNRDRPGSTASANRHACTCISLFSQLERYSSPFISFSCEGCTWSPHGAQPLL